MQNKLSLFEGENPGFETLSHQNGNLHWYASVVMEDLGYTDFKITAQPILKAYQVCVNTGIDPLEHFAYFDNEKDGKRFKDIKLTRFACYLIVMNADIRKPNVSKAQAYFAEFTTAIHQYFIEQQDIERIDLRGQISEHEKTLNSTAKQAGVTNYAFFQNKGYLGLYNMPLARIKEIKGIPENRTPFDFMGAEELGANIFSVTQTDAKIKREKIMGQKKLEEVAYGVGKMVRNALIENGSTLPEDLFPSEDIKQIKSGLKKTHKAFNKNDNVKKLPPKKRGVKK